MSCLLQRRPWWGKRIYIFRRTGSDETRPWVLLGIWTFVFLLEAGTLCILLPLTQLKDDIGGNIVYLVTKTSFTELHDKMHIDSFTFVFTNKGGGGMCFNRAKHLHFAGSNVIKQCFLLSVNYWHLSSSMEVECMFSLCTAHSWFRCSPCWCEAETGQGNSFDDEIRGSQADCLLAFREPYKLRAAPSPCLDITCSFEFQITGAIDLHDLS